MKQYSLKVNSVYDDAKTITRVIDKDTDIVEYIDNHYVHERFIVEANCELKLKSIIDARNVNKILANGLVDVYHHIVLNGDGARVTIDTRGAVNGGNRIIYRSNIETKDETLRELSGSESMQFIILDQGSEVDAIPAIGIINNNVELGHKLVISRINDKSRHYLAMHGLSNETIDDMYVEGIMNS